MEYSEKIVPGFQVQLEGIAVPGWIYLILALLSLWISFRAIKTLIADSSRRDYFISLSVGTLIPFILMFLTIQLTGGVVKQFKREFFTPKYNAKIVNNGNPSYVTFATENRIVKIPVNMILEQGYELGSDVRVAYEEGQSTAYILNGQRFITYFAEFIFLAIFYSALAFVMGAFLQNDFLVEKSKYYATALFGYIIIPLAMLFLFLMMCSAVLNKLMGPSEISWGAFFITLIFCIILGGSIYAYCKLVFSSSPDDLYGRVSSKNKRT